LARRKGNRRFGHGGVLDGRADEGLADLRSEARRPGFFPEYAHEPFEAEKWLFQAARQGEGAAAERLLEAIEIDVQRASYRPDADILQWLQQQAGSGNAKAKELLVKVAAEN
jgi:hypothetical protein